MQFRALSALLLLSAAPAAAAPSAKRVQQLFKSLKTGNFTDFYALFTPTSTWNTIGFGVRTKPQMIAVFDAINCLLSNPPLTITIDRIISEGDYGAYTSVQAHVPNGYIGTNGMGFSLSLSASIFLTYSCADNDFVKRGGV
jgi:hypothetical protein